MSKEDKGVEYAGERQGKRREEKELTEDGDDDTVGKSVDCS